MKNSVEIIHHATIQSLQTTVNSWLHGHKNVTVKSIQYQREQNSHVAFIWYED